MCPAKATPLAESLFSWTSPHIFFSLLLLMGKLSTPVTAESVCMPCQSDSGFAKSLCNLLLGQDIYTKTRNAQLLTISVRVFAW